MIIIIAIEYMKRLRRLVNYMNMFSIPKRFFNRIKKELFIKNFKSFDISSGIGNIGFGDTCEIVGKHNISVGKNTWIGPNSELLVYDSHFQQKLNSNLSFGDNVRIQCRIRITCAGNIIIGNDVLFGPDVFVTDHNHGMDATFNGGYSPQNIIIDDVKIEDGCWIGQRCCIMPGVNIGAHSIIGTNSVVTKSIPPYSIAVGSPAKVVKTWDFEKSKWVKVE